MFFQRAIDPPLACCGPNRSGDAPSRAAPAAVPGGSKNQGRWIVITLDARWGTGAVDELSIEFALVPSIDIVGVDTPLLDTLDRAFDIPVPCTDAFLSVGGQAVGESGPAGAFAEARSRGAQGRWGEEEGREDGSLGEMHLGDESAIIALLKGVGKYICNKESLFIISGWNGNGVKIVC